MSIFPTRRRPFNTDRPVTGENLTGYEERYELPIDGGMQGGFGAEQPTAEQAQSTGFGQSGFTQSAFGQAPQNTSVSTATALAPDVAGARLETQSAERPMVFALRAFADMFVYEYSDRFEYYRRTVNGMERCNTEYKHNI